VAAFFGEAVSLAAGALRAGAVEDRSCAPVFLALVGPLPGALAIVRYTVYPEVRVLPDWAVPAANRSI